MELELVGQFILLYLHLLCLSFAFKYSILNFWITNIGFKFLLNFYQFLGNYMEFTFTFFNLKNNASFSLGYSFNSCYAITYFTCINRSPSYGFIRFTVKYFIL